MLIMVVGAATHGLGQENFSASCEMRRAKLGVELATGGATQSFCKSHACHGLRHFAT